MNSKYDQRARTSIYETIRGRIENLYYEPGSELSIAELTQDLGVSRSPVRDALLRLERDKLIDIYPQRGTWVAKLGVENIMQERFLRLSVEENVFRKCIDAVLEDEERKIRFSSRLRANLVQQKACLSLNDIRTFLDLDVEFHRMFYIEIGFERIYKIVEAHTGNERRIRILNNMNQVAAQAVYEEHLAMTDAIDNADSGRALEILAHHFSKLKDEVDELVRLHPSYFTDESKRKEKE